MEKISDLNIDEYKDDKIQEIESNIKQSDQQQENEKDKEKDGKEDKDQTLKDSGIIPQTELLAQVHYTDTYRDSHRCDYRSPVAIHPTWSSENFIVEVKDEQKQDQDDEQNVEINKLRTNQNQNQDKKQLIKDEQHLEEGESHENQIIENKVEQTVKVRHRHKISYVVQNAISGHVTAIASSASPSQLGGIVRRYQKNKNTYDLQFRSNLLSQNQK
ncbi:MAG: hypothetical protein EZS28_004032 [Streblomastix strix]|uniref:Uncharacterized protein n=1 Tax=Streblomastix strix TaxID=222440 RepID=A0A5J4X1E7_9EUKA|nr:MAG: hypothetical protein EZS28_004032 [Streblomastix strix]